MQSEITTSGKSGVINDQYKIISEKRKKSGVQTRPWVKVECLHCGAIYEGWKQTVQRKVNCRGCLSTNKPKPAALKTDNDGNCVTICRMGQLEYIHQLITEDGLTQQGAVESFIEAVQAHSNDGDPITNELTVEMVRSQYRRDSGKLKETPKKPLVEPTKEITVHASVESQEESHTKVVVQKYKCLPTVVGVQVFLDEHLPGFRIVPDLNGET